MQRWRKLAAPRMVWNSSRLTEFPETPNLQRMEGLSRGRRSTATARQAIPTMVHNPYSLSSLPPLSAAGVSTEAALPCAVSLFAIGDIIGAPADIVFIRGLSQLLKCCLKLFRVTTFNTVTNCVGRFVGLAGER